MLHETMIILCFHTLNFGELKDREPSCAHLTSPVLTQAIESCVQQSNWPDSVTVSKFHGQLRIRTILVARVHHS